MKAIVQLRYGPPRDVLALTDVDMPTLGDDDVLVRVVASSANPWDWHFILGEPLVFRTFGIGGLRRPHFTIPGGDVAGVVERAGRDVSGFEVGDEVYGFGHGAFAEFVAVPAASLAPKPASLSFEQSAAVPLAAMTALQCLKAGALESGQRALIIGATGGVGSFAVQIARHLGAEVTGVASTVNLDVARDLGAHRVIDYLTEDPTAPGARYDLVLQLAGTYSPRAIRRTLTPRGTLIQSFGDGSRWFGPVGNIAMASILNTVVSQRLTAYEATETTESLQEVTALIEAGAVKPLIHRSFPLAEAAEAVALVRDGRPAGKVTVLVAP